MKTVIKTERVFMLTHPEAGLHPMYAGHRKAQLIPKIELDYGETWAALYKMGYRIQKTVVSWKEKMK